jgi:hypothetical protein
MSDEEEGWSRCGDHWVCFGIRDSIDSTNASRTLFLATKATAIKDVNHHHHVVLYSISGYASPIHTGLLFTQGMQQP